MSFLDDYEPVEERLPKFWADHADGAVHTELHSYDGTDVVFKATLIRGDGRPLATGWAQEKVGQGNVNKTAAVENCETSAIGRALANAGYAPKGKRPSREEMRHAEPDEERPELAPPEGFASNADAKAVADSIAAQVNGLSIEDRGAFVEWKADQQFPYPWPAAACDAMLAELERIAMSHDTGEEEPF